MDRSGLREAGGAVLRVRQDVHRGEHVMVLRPVHALRLGGAAGIGVVIGGVDVVPDRHDLTADQPAVLVDVVGLSLGEGLDLLHELARRGGRRRIADDGQAGRQIG